MPDEQMRPLTSHYQMCFGCGTDHPTGLHIQMSGGGDRVEGWFVVGEHHQGAPGLAHGGIIASAMDEGMGYLLHLVASPAVTAHLEVNFRKPVPVGSTLHMVGILEKVEGRKIFGRMTGTVDGEVVVDASSLFLKVGIDHFIPHARRYGATMAQNPYNP